MPTAIKVENLSKAYQLGQIGTGTLSQDIDRWLKLKRGKEDPFLKIGETNDRTKQGESNVVWSLRDISFEIQQGDAVGIIGRNGAGKSTLLKLLSRVTAPSTGIIKAKGRIASLLEVGTGFHPELSGKENIYLNGAILGMRKKEIDRKLDEIISFSGVERYIDTPVKRYSSGMYVRLAFAVAAYLDSEILIVDEVLAVGDAEFQKKCLGKMKEVSTEEGRTVLFVSHNINAVLNLTSKSILLVNGQLTYFDRTDKVVEKYLQNAKVGSSYCNEENIKNIYFKEISALDSGFIHNEKIVFELNIVSNENLESLAFGIGILNSFDEYVGNRLLICDFKVQNGSNRFKLSIENHNLVPGEYKGVFAIARDKTNELFDVVMGNPGFTIFNDNADEFLLSKWNKAFGDHYLPNIKLERDNEI